MLRRKQNDPGVRWIILAVATQGVGILHLHIATVQATLPACNPEAKAEGSQIPVGRHSY